MKRKIEQAVALIRQNRTKRRRTAALLLALSCFVSANVFWALRDIGTALTEEAVCGMEEHVHSAECYETVPADEADPEAGICVDEDGNTVPRLICGKEEHIHSAECVPAPAADVESPADWEGTLPDSTADSLREQLARTAESQLGYTESERNFAVTNGERRNYSRYGQWYGSPYGDWNPLFVYFCLYYAGVPEDRIPGRGGCWAWSVKLAKEGLIRTAENGTPVRGDILLLDQDADGRTDRIGIVTLTQTAEEGLVIAAAEGACDGTAAERCYLWNDPCIAGFVSPEDPETLPALEYSVASGSRITVHASAETDVFPAGTVMSVTDIAPEEAMQLAEEAADETELIQSALAVDISFCDTEGNELEPADGQSVRVCISLPDHLQFRGDTLRLLHRRDDGTTEAVPDAVFTEDAVSFDAEAFSIYVVSGGSEQLAVGNTVGEGFNTPDNPYVMKVGETVRLIGYSNVERYLDPTDKSVIMKAGDPNDWNNPRWVNGEFRTESDFIAKKAGTTTVVIQYNTPDGQEAYQEFFVRVEETPDSILVYQHYQPDGKGYNHIKEALSSGDLNTADVEGYIPNGNAQNPMFSEPYTLVPGQEVELFPLVPEGTDPNDIAQLEIWDNWNNAYLEQITPISGKPGAIRLRALRPGMIRIRNNKTNQFMYINVRDYNANLTHADMEIADNGRYTTTFPSYDEEGNPVTKVRVYNAYIDYVNWSRVYAQDGRELAYFTSNYDPAKPWAPDGCYQKIGEIGSTQYEYTSAFICGNNMNWSAGDTDHAVFNVNMTLVPNYEYTIAADGTVSADTPLNNSQDNWVYFKDLEFNMNKQDVIDAFNKCPFTNGLDFTIKADVTNEVISHVLVPELTKVMENGELADQQFEFEMTELNSEDAYDYTFKYQWHDGEHISKQDREFQRIQQGYAFDTAYQIVKRTSNPGEFEWGNDVDGNALAAALQANHEFNIRGIYTPDRVYQFLDYVIDVGDSAALLDFASIAQNCVTGSTEIEEGDLHFAIPKTGYYMFRYKKPAYRQTVRNDASGHAEFEPIQYSEPGTYYYKIREIIPEDADWDLIDYDTRQTIVKITIREENGKFIKTVELLDESGGSGSLRFVNKYHEYHLPATGGSGVIPYLFAGTGIISLSILLIYRRRKEVFDSR